jgi:anthraniloyl-CoA monooxygenase
MKIICVGGGPAGLYFALLMKKVDPSHDVTVLERNAPDATFGWGVVFSEETLGALREADLETFDEITETFAKWSAIDVLYGGEKVRSRGHVFSGIRRTRLLDILQRRCLELGVQLEFHREVDDPAGLASECDLLVGADGVHSLVREALPEAFRPAVHQHGTKFAWFGAEFAFDAFTFLFRQNDHGLFQVHAYPFDADTSTFIVECPEEVWRRAGLDRANEEESIAYCERLFAPELGGHRLLSNKSNWISFLTLRNENWHQDNIVLMGDAAHTAHFTIGSGTKLAMEDAVSLADALRRRSRDLRAAFTDYEMERQPLVERFQEAATESATYFENVSRYSSFAPVQFTFNLLTRSGRITHGNLVLRDPVLVARVDAWCAGRGDTREGGPPVAPPPMLTPVRLGDDSMTNRVTLSPRLIAESGTAEGLPGRAWIEALKEARTAGGGLVLTEMVAVSADGRITPETSGLYADEHGEAWKRLLDDAPTGASPVAVLLGHAGPRGSTRPRHEGLDRPLREGGWPLLAASAVSHTRRGPTPREMSADDMARVRQDFATSAGKAAKAGADCLVLHFGHGYLVASFISPLTNHRTDEYGGDLEARMRFPLEVLDAVAAMWPPGRPIGVAISATDWVRGGFDADDAVAVARMLKAHGCHFIHTLAGQTTLRARPDYRRLFLVPYSDRIRNEAAIPTLVSGGITTADEVNTIVAAGRADLCLMEVHAIRG